MAKHSFSVQFPGAAADFVAKAKGVIEKNRGTLTGNTDRGDFSVPTPAGTVKGAYTITGQSFTIDITDKPFIVPGSAIEAQVRKFLTES